MKNFISSIYVKPNSISDEKICVGLFIGGETTSYFAWSENKLKLTTKLASESVYSSLHRSFININNDITHKIGHESKGAIVKKHVYSSEYFQYLTNYNKGLIEFTSPKTISKSVDEKEFEKLFKLYVGENIIKLNKEIKETFAKKISSVLKKAAFKERADINYKVDEHIVATAYRPHKVDFISCNGSVLAGQAIDFTTGATTIENKLYEFRALSEGLMEFAKRRDFDGEGKYEVYFNEPVEKEQKKILDNVMKDKSKPFTLKEIENLENVIRTLQNNNYRRFSEKL